MDNFINSFLQDPVLLTAGLVFLATIFILFWVLHSWRNVVTVPGFPDSENDLTVPGQGSNTGLLEARLQEMGNQITDMRNHLEALEKMISAWNPSARTEPSAAPQETENFRKDIERLDAKLDLLMKSRPTDAPEDALKSLENKLEGIHRLLIVLTDSGSAAPDQQ